MYRADSELYALKDEISDEELIWQLSARINVYEDTVDGDLTDARD